MAFNVKTQFAEVIRTAALARPPGSRHGISGFWRASLARVQGERLFRIASLQDARFVLEAEVDASATHQMVPTRTEEYLEHELFKRSAERGAISVNEARKIVQDCIAQGRIVVAFRNARAIDAPTEHTAQNPVWYTEP